MSLPDFLKGYRRHCSERLFPHFFAIAATALSCSWLYAYPYISGKVNYYVTGTGFGSLGREVFEPGWILLAIPYNWLRKIVQNLKEMKWELTAYTLGKEKFTEWEKGILTELARESQNP